jgi:hypothetical protein
MEDGRNTIRRVRKGRCIDSILWTDGAKLMCLLLAIVERIPSSDTILVTLVLVEKLKKS